MNYGFIITRHVNSEKTNEYWNHSVKLIKSIYPSNQIVIIDDDSNYDFVRAEHEYENIILIQSEYPKRGELLPFIYFLQHKWFDNAIIIHDSLFIHRKIPFEAINLPVLPLWHHPNDKENIQNSIRIVSYLRNNQKLYSKITGKEMNVLGFNYDKFAICFGCQCFINIHFLEKIDRKYNILNLTNAVNCRADRCTLERIFGLIFTEECTQLRNGKLKSLFGEITRHHKSFKYFFDEYMNDFKNRRIPHMFVKVWTGR